MRTKALLLTVVLLVAGLGVAKADVLWDQGMGTTPTVGYAGGAFLGIATLETNSNKVDDFTLNSTASITSVTFWVINQTNTGPAAPMRAKVEFFSDAGGTPANSGLSTLAPDGWNPYGTAASISAFFPWSSTANAANGELYTAAAQTDGSGMTATDVGDGVYEVTVNLPTAFVATAGTHYWVGFDCSNQVDWQPGTPADFFGVAVTGQVAGTSPGLEAGIGTLWGGGFDFQFVLNGTAVPEPVTMALLAVGAIGMVIRRRRAA